MKNCKELTWPGQGKKSLVNIGEEGVKAVDLLDLIFQTLFIVLQGVELNKTDRLTTSG